MKFRHNPYPQRLFEIWCFLAVGVLLPIVCMLEIIIVLPEIHKPGGFPYILAILMATFLLFNVESNVLAVMIIDTSIDREHIKNSISNGSMNCLDWRYCKICDSSAPPRSWHCKICNICMLKRDHHCVFTGCCIGHQNHRYFICFLLHLCIGSVYFLIYLSYYLLCMKEKMFNKLKDELIPYKHVFNRWTLMMYLHLYAYGLCVTVLILSFATLTSQVSSVIRGKTFFEKKKSLQSNRTIYHNLRSVFGQRMLVAWLCPLIQSDLPDDGYIGNT